MNNFLNKKDTTEIVVSQIYSSKAKHKDLKNKFDYTSFVYNDAFVFSAKNLVLHRSRLDSYFPLISNIEQFLFDSVTIRFLFANSKQKNHYLNYHFNLKNYVNTFDDLLKIESGICYCHPKLKEIYDCWLEKKLPPKLLKTKVNCKIRSNGLCYQPKSKLILANSLPFDGATLEEYLADKKLLITLAKYYRQKGKRIIYKENKNEITALPTTFKELFLVESEELWLLPIVVDFIAIINYLPQVRAKLKRLKLTE